MKVIIAASEAEAVALQAATDQAMGYPRKSVHVGDGRHVDMPEDWDGQGEPPPGWCRHYVEIHHAESKEAAIPLDDGDAARLVAKLDVLREQDRTALSKALGERVEKDLEAEGYQPRSTRNLAGIDVRR